MLKKIILAVALMLPAFAFAQSTVKIGVVDTNTLLQAMPETSAAQTKLADVSKKYEETYNKLIEEYKRLAEEFQSMKEDTPAAIKEKNARDLADKQTRIQQFEQQAQEDLGKQQNELMAPIMQKVKSAIEAIGAEGKFTVISEKPAFIYIGSDAVDITNDVKNRLGLK